MNRENESGTAVSEPGAAPAPATSPEERTGGAHNARGLWEVLVLGALGGVRGDEKAAFGEALRRALRRPVLPHQAVRLWLSSATLALLTALVVTGAALTLRYVPTAEGAWPSVQAIDQSIAGGWFVRQTHLWCGRLVVFLLALSLLRMLFAADYKYRGFDKWVAANLLFFVALGFFATGAALPRGAWGRDATETLAAVVADVPVIGGMMRAFLVEPAHDPQGALTRSFVAHVVFLPWTMFFLVLIVHSTRTRPRPAGVAAAWERPQNAAPLWPDRILESAVAAVVALGAAATLAFLLPIDLGPAPGSAAAPGPGVDPVLRAFTGVAGLSSGKDGGALTGTAAALGLLCAAAGAFFALAFLDRGTERGWRARKPIVGAGVLLFAALLCVAVLGKARP